MSALKESGSLRTKPTFRDATTGSDVILRGIKPEVETQNIGYFVRLRIRLIVSFFFNICLYFQAYSLKCKLCFSAESWDDCKNTTKETTCTDDFDRCVTQEGKSESPQKTVKLFAKGCATSSLCRLGQLNCRPTEPSTKITKCEVICCKGDLCNGDDNEADNGAKVPIVSAIMLLACAFVAFAC